MKKERYAVTGMTCSACSAHVQKAVAAVPGVHSVQVNLLQNNMTVEFEEAETTPETIFAAVKKAGYGAAPLSQIILKENRPVFPVHICFFLNFLHHFPDLQHSILLNIQSNLNAIFIR